MLSGHGNISELADQWGTVNATLDLLNDTNHLAGD